MDLGKKFEIKEREAKKYNATAINLDNDPKNQFLWRFIVVIGVIILAIISGIIYYFNQKMKYGQGKSEE